MLECIPHKNFSVLSLWGMKSKQMLKTFHCIWKPEFLFSSFVLASLLHETEENKRVKCCHMQRWSCTLGAIIIAIFSVGPYQSSLIWDFLKESFLSESLFLGFLIIFLGNIMKLAMCGTTSFVVTPVVFLILLTTCIFLQSQIFINKSCVSLSGCLMSESDTLFM